jgi:diaminopimelate decarboxylase
VVHPQGRDPSKHGAAARRVVARHLPYPLRLCAEPGRTLVAETGVLIATAMGTAERAGNS